ncbi:hypothetical protein D9613_012803 [Agrocybe pediades]|uniref:Nephrocystin 3-like N-terminal domain-containing protein n=1 Tax=Agrocybe pediades TaxID=84607 RepID=A0A8H4VVB6_9AGAR|nr:hypothetical protein D9613_012803 [Agrocybe pediades]
MAHSGTLFPPLINLTHSIVAGGTFTQHISQHNYTRSGERPGYVRLLENVATAALHDSVHVVDAPKCHPNTRVAIIQCIIDWGVGMDPEQSGKPILWLTGGAGAGKSAIARSVAERCSDEGLLLGTFFFGAADPTRNHVEKLVATLSSQISIVLPEFKDMVAAFIEDDPLIFDRSIKTQFSTLIIRPLSAILANRPADSTTTPRVIIIDGLDECSAINSQRDLLLALHEVTSTTTLIRFLLCSRPESHLNNAFSLPHIVPVICKIFLDDDYVTSKDIRVYLVDKFRQIKEGHPFRKRLPDPWPTPKTVETLVDKSSGHFIYAATVIRYVESPRHRPDQRLDAIFQLRPPFKDLPFTELDALYRLIISKAEDPSTVLDILTFRVLYGSVHSPSLRACECQYIEAILQLEEGSVEVLLADLQSIVTVSGDSEFPPNVMFLHKSLYDFLSEPQRAGDLYRDLSRAQLSHVARVINIFSSHRASRHDEIWSGSQVTEDHDEMNFGVTTRLSQSIKADWVSSDIIQAIQQFPTSEFLRPLLCNDVTVTEIEGQDLYDVMFNGDLQFIECYFLYLYHIKNISDSTRLLYWEQMRQYCKCVLAVLDDNNLSSKWNAHFVCVYYHLLHDPRYHLPRRLSHIDLFRDTISGIDFGEFGYTITNAIGQQGELPHSKDISTIFHDLMEGIQKDIIFAKAVGFCLALLCEEWRARQDAGRIYGISRHDRRRKREHPWHWRQIVPRPPSLGNRLAVVGSWVPHDQHVKYVVRLTKIRKELRNSKPCEYIKTQVITMQEYFQVKSEPVPQFSRTQHERPQQWPLFVFLLDLLPHILPLAARYEPLVDMCRKKCLSSLSQVWPKKSRRARQAIDSYLRRVDSQEGGP